MCIRDREDAGFAFHTHPEPADRAAHGDPGLGRQGGKGRGPVSYTHLRAHETVLDLVCRLLLEKKQSMNMSNSRSSSQTTDQHLQQITNERELAETSCNATHIDI